MVKLMKRQYRILTNGKVFKVQHRCKFLIWWFWYDLELCSVYSDYSVVPEYNTKITAEAAIREYIKNDLKKPDTWEMV